MSVVSVVIGLIAAFLFALAAFYQQRAARQSDADDRQVVKGAYQLMAGLVRNRVWLTGWVVNLAGFGAQALALHLGSIVTVQPLLATQLLFALPLSSWERRRWPRAADWASAAAICAGLVVLLVDVHITASGVEADRHRVLLAAVAWIVLVSVLVGVTRGASDDVKVVVTSGCAGLCFAMTALFIKLTTDDLVNHGVGYTAVDWVGYALAVSTLLGLVLEQAAFAHGSLPWAVATKESVNPIGSFAVGVLVFPVALPTDAASLAGLAVAAVLVVAGAIGLAHSPSADLWLTNEPQEA